MVQKINMEKMAKRLRVKVPRGEVYKRDGLYSPQTIYPYPCGCAVIVTNGCGGELWRWAHCDKHQNLKLDWV